MGGKNVDQRWKACVMSTNLAFGFALTPAYLRQVAFTQKAHDHVHQMVSDVKTAFIRHLEALEWLKGEEKTRRAIQTKIQRAHPHMAYPDWIGKIEAINDMYEDLKIDPDDFLINIVSIVNSNNYVRESRPTRYIMEAECIHLLC